MIYDDWKLILITMAAGAVLAAVFTWIEIPILKKKQFGQYIRDEGPKSHQAKSGTPTMGGLALYGAVTVAALITPLYAKVRESDIWVMVAAGLLFGLIGFIDDYIKVAKKHNLGLTVKQKFALQILFALAFASYVMFLGGGQSVVWIPIVNYTLDIGWLYIPFAAFVLVAMANAVNLSDGLDGLCAGITFIEAAFFAIAAHSLGKVPSMLYLAALAGGCFGFLVWNHHPAKIFMGDTGSMALGAGLTAGVIMMRTELLIPIAGFIYVAEVLSVIIQVLYFKKTGGKRFFRMAPIHHHFELGGMSEVQVVLMFWGFALACCVLTWFML